ncbi:nucleotidyltransferase family protein [Cylindrospermopsis raciborskii G7]|uniref:nucleotidyltransferase family protein n=1 Tax=Cylindrospermopsis raciborskii TaxID=77022 RepID=UPI003EBDA054
MTKANWKETVISPETSLGEAIARIDKSALQVAVILNTDQTMAGILTDGDIRRAILAGKSLEIKVIEVMNATPTTVPMSMPRSEMLALMRRQTIHHLPIIDENRRLIGLATLDDLVGVVERPNWVIIMAGGLGTRLHPLTKECPKPLLKVGGKPILEIIVESFAEQGFKQIFLSVNYKADMIQDYFGEGDRWGVQFNYIHEKERLGTAGALSLLPERPTAPIIVMNGDILTRTSFDSLLKFHEAQNSVATMSVREYEFQVPYGVVQMDGIKIKAIEEKPLQRFFVNAGIYTLNPEVLEYIPNNTFFDMPTLFEHLISANQATAAYPLREYWLDIGRMGDLEKANQQIGTLIE